MTYSIHKYTGVGSSQYLAVPAYISRDHIKVEVDGVALPSHLWVWVTDSTIQLTAAAGAAIRIYRESSPGARLVDYVDGVPLTEASLDVDSKQAFFLAQEQLDATSEALAVFGASNFAAVAESIRIDAVAAANASAYSTATTAVAGIVADATAAKDAAVAAAAVADSASRLTIGTVTTGAAGSSASATIAGVTGSQTLSFAIPRGDVGATGPAGPTGPTGPAGGITSLGVTAPLASTGGATPTLSVNAATTSTPGSMSAADKTKLDAITGTHTGTNTGDQDLSSFATKAGAETLTNKRVTSRRGSITSHATPTFNTDSYDVLSITAQAEAITSMTTNLTGTPVHGDPLIVEVTGTAAQTISWGTKFEASTVALPTTTVTTAMLSVAFLYNGATSKWRCVGVA